MITDLKDFEKFLKICRKQGVTDVSYQGVTVKFGDLPTKEASMTDADDEIPTDALTAEQLMYYAVQS